MTGLEALLLMSVITSGVGIYQTEAQAQAARSARRKQEKEGIRNQNAIVEEGFRKRTGGATGLGQPLGNTASQQGGILQGLGDGQASILG